MAKAKPIEQMTAEELLEYKNKRAAAAAKKAEKEAADKAKDAAVELRSRVLAIIDIVKKFSVPKLFSGIRAEKKDPNLEDITILSAIAEVAGVKDVSITKAAKKSGGASTGTRNTYTDEFKAKAVKMVADGKKKADVAKELDVATATLTKWIENAKKK